ncbi:MAG: acetyl-CoA C-acyltransferase [Candidatus Marinimicrobia bacterium]|nr:acetyl-CoA C-acyltransferase [Candidatus Neomarinimicrobiota bacterium]|tara:strand:- start:739 stop:1923 length:1185 start_codon:yes stop_codon:yes gene_type:complete
MQRKSVIVAAKRTPIGAFQGGLSPLSASDLGAIVIKNVLDDAKVETHQVDEVIMGNVLSAGQGQAPARQATLKSGCSNSVESLTINKMCGSGLKAVMIADQAVRCGDADIIVAGGMESMSNAPHLIQDIRSGKRLGHGNFIDSMIHDGLWDVYNDKHMGNCAEMLAIDRNYTRESQDEYAIGSYNRSISAIERGIFNTEIVPVEVPKRGGGSIQIEKDEEPTNVIFEKISKLRPAFESSGTITAGNASKLNDGAAALLVMEEQKAKELGIKPLGSILGHLSSAHDPEWFTTAPGKAIEALLNKYDLNSDDIDLWEINEAFSVVSMAAIEDFNLNREKVNIYGGAVALGHPIGASGARILTTLINGMVRTDSKLGLATLCIGGGEASALIVQRHD